MIDTVVINFPRHEVKIADTDSQGVKWNLQSRTNGYDKYVRNPSLLDLESGSYFPRLTGYHRKGIGVEWGKTIRVEFSVPKLLYSNNLDELSTEDFDSVVEVLKNRLDKMGMIVSKKQLEDASITTVHYSKNIVLLKGYSAQYVIRELHKINLGKRFDLTRARFMNDGESLYGYTQAHSFVLYDKVSDLVRPSKRVIDREQSAYQKDLFGTLHTKKEILRFEVRLCNKRKINSLFKELGFSENPTLKDVLSLQKAQAVLNNYWTTIIENGSVGLFTPTLTNKELLEQLFIHSPPSLKAKQAIYQVGLVQLAKDGNGLRELRSILTKNGTNARSWYRIIEDYRELSELLKNIKPRDWVEQIKSQIVNYEPLRIKIT